MTTSTLEGQGQTFEWRTSDYNRDLVDDFKAAVPSSGRVWNRGYKSGYRSYSPGYWEVAAQYWQTVIDLSNKHGCHVETYGQVEQVQSRQYRITLDYMGLVRHRGGDTYTSSGWVNYDWNVTFSLAVLQDWFKFTMGPGEMPTLFGVLGVDASLDGIAFDKALKKAYRAAVRTWHPDVCKEPEAEETFKTIQKAYEKLDDRNFRRRYAAGLKLEKRIERGSAVTASTAINWRPPIRCGTLVIQAKKTMGKYEVEKILDWQPIVNVDGHTMVTYWPPGANTFSTRWVE
jgi:hypothetical protein